MNNEMKDLEMREAMKAVSDLATACYNEGVKDALICVAIGAGLATTVYLAEATNKIFKDRKAKKELKKID